MANRPVVLVYQEYASISVPTATPELAAAVIAPAYQIIDYPEDSRAVASDGSLTPVMAGKFGALNTGVDVPSGSLDVTYRGLKTGATVDLASVAVFVENARGQVKRATAMTTVALGTTIKLPSDATAFGIRVLDWCTLTDANSKVLTRRVRSFSTTTVANDTVHFTDEFPADSSAWTNGSTIVAEFERDLGTVQLPSTDFTAIADKVTINAALTVSTLKVAYAEIYLAYRALRSDLAAFGTLSDFRLSSSGELGSVGKVDARNPLAAALYVAAKNTNTPILYYGVTRDDGVGYTAAKAALSGRNDVYAVAVMSSDPANAASFASDFMSSADPDYALTNGVAQKFRMAFGSAGALPLVKTLVQKKNATTVASGSVVDQSGGFVDAGVIVGDLVRFYLVDGTLDSRTVTTVVSNQSLVISGGLPAVTAYDVVRDISTNKDEQVKVLVARAPGNRRLVLCWPDLVDVQDLVDGSKPRAADGSKVLADPQPGCYMAAGVVGMVASLPSHQGLTNFAINGIKRVYNTNPYFTDKQLTTLSNAGLFVVTQDDASSPCYIVHELTTDTSAIEFGEVMCVKNMDYVSMAIRDVLSGFTGKWNLTPETLGFMQAAVQAEVDSLLIDKRAKIGSRLISAKITQVAESTVSADRAEIYVEGKFPKTLNTIGLHIVSN